MTSRPLHFLSLLLALSTFALLGLGGLVTSHGVGMAVPDWPNTYGYNMFFFPVSQWVGGIFYEHTHRLLASAVGFLTSILALWLYGKKARPFMRWTGIILALVALATLARLPGRWTDALVLAVTGSTLLLASFIWPRCEPAPTWLRRLGLIAFCAVVLQGVLGGLRVVWLKDQIGIFHATLAQLFLCLTSALALFTSPWWRKGNSSECARPRAQQPPPTEDVNTSSGPRAVPARSSPDIATALQPSTLDFGPRTLFLLATLLILAQLILGATMRHQHAGLAIPDFPLAYGKLWPATDPASVVHHNQQRLEVTDSNPITAFQITLQMVHRLLAGLILLAVAACAWLARRSPANTPSQRGVTGTAPHRNRFNGFLLTLFWLALIIAQALLGATTIWSNKAADVATAHVLVGALSLVTGVLLTIIFFCDAASSAVRSRAPLDSSAAADSPLKDLAQPEPSIRLRPI